ncbi:RDD family protein [Microbacterium sp.]|uniref:RDD family protein n=1 Tax=Microbacterium sp. TaxID=51671 RepID=UPI0039E6D94B
MIWQIDDEVPRVDGVDAQGRPDPAYAAELGLVRAPFGRRSLAFAGDVAIWLMLQLPLWLGAMPLVFTLLDGSISPYGFVNHPRFVFSAVMAAVSVVLMLVCALVQWLLQGLRGMTIGKAMLGLRSVNVRTLERPGVGAVLLRFLIVAASALVPVIGPTLVLLSPTFDPQGRGRGWHDRATNVWLVDVRAGLNPFDEKRMRIARKTVKVEPVQERAELPSLATPRDPAVQPEYRPGGRISAGVLGVSRSSEPRGSAPLAQPAAAQLSTPPVAPQPVAPQPVAAQQPAAQPVAAQPVAPQPVAAQQPAIPQPVAPQPVAAQPVRPAPAQPAVLALRLDTGESIVVSGLLLVGRDPDPTAHPGARPLAIGDTTKTLSKTHALVRPVAGGLELVDCHSTNGCAVIRGGVEHELAPGSSAVVYEGDAIRLGDRLATVVRTGGIA